MKLCLLKRAILPMAFFILCIPAHALADVGISGKGQMSRGQDVSSVNLRITITGVDAQDFPAGVPENSVIHQRLVVTLPELPDNADGDDDSTKRVRFSNESPVPGTTPEEPVDGWELVPTESMEKVLEQGATTYKLTLYYALRNTGHPTKLTDMLKDDEKVEVSIKWSGSADSHTESIFINQLTGVVNEAPPNFTAHPAHRSIAVSWDAVTTVAYNSDEAPNAEPAGATVFIVDTSVLTNHEFSAILYKENKNEETASNKCVFSADPAMDTCDIACDPSSYMDVAAADQVNGVTVRNVSYPDHGRQENELDIEKKYAVFAMFQPDGLVTTQCVMVQPGENLSLSEVNGADAATPGDPHCFIATAAYGSPLNQHINTLRWFRGRYLMPNKWGRELVRFYYRNSPPLAQWISEHDEARKLARGLLWVPVLTIEGWRTSPGLMSTLLVLIGGLVLFLRRQWKKTVNG